MSADDILTDPNDQITTDPPELQAAFTKILSLTLARQLAEEHKKPWTAALETKLQGWISELVATAKTMGLTTFTVIVIKPSGKRVTRELQVDRISRERTLQ